MKVENHNQAQGAQNIDMNSAVNAELQATLLMRVLSRATEEIQEATLEAKAEPLKTEGNEGALPSTKGTSKKEKSNEAKILECFITSLNMDREVHLLTQETVKTLLTKSKQMLEDFKDLKSQIDEISNKLNDMMARNIIEKVRMVINQMIDRVQKAFAKEQKALEAITNGEDAKGMLDEARSEIGNIIAAIEELITEVPGMKAELTEFIQTLKDRGPVAAIGEKILKKLDEIELERNGLESQLAKLLEAQSALLRDLSSQMRELKETLGEISTLKTTEITEKNFKEILESILDHIKKAVERDVNESKDFLDVRANNYMINPDSQNNPVYG